MNEKLVYKQIFKYLQKENEDLEKLDSGIFFAPEIYLAFQIGKSFKTNEQKLFGEKIIWHREYDLKNGGPSDIIIKKGSGRMIAFELKICDTYHSYIRDLEKLKRIDRESNSIESTFFIALIDTFRNKHPGDRVNLISLYENVEPLSKEFNRFPTKYSRYIGEMDCVLGMWKVS